jgi:hypothetical protein
LTSAVSSVDHNNRQDRPHIRLFVLWEGRTPLISRILLKSADEAAGCNILLTSKILKFLSSLCGGGKIYVHYVFDVEHSGVMVLFSDSNRS